jgi:CHAT domain-containing protein
MERFYAALARGATKDEALVRAQRAAIRAGQPPMRWAAYQLYGDWR